MIGNMPALMKLISRRVNILRTQTGLTQEELARKSRVSQKTVSNIENEGGPGRTTCKLQHLDAIANALGLQLWQLLLPDDDDRLLDPATAKKIRYIIDQFLAAPDDGRETLSRVAEVIGKYKPE